jgi:hypothetical protein
VYFGCNAPVPSSGETHAVSLNDIYKEAQEMFGDIAKITEAIY